MKNIRLFNARGGQEDLSNLFGDKTMKFRLEIEEFDRLKYMEITKLWIPLKDTNTVELSTFTDDVVAIKIKNNLRENYLVIEE